MPNPVNPFEEFSDPEENGSLEEQGFIERLEEGVSKLFSHPGSPREIDRPDIPLSTEEADTFEALTGSFHAAPREEGADKHAKQEEVSPFPAFTGWLAGTTASQREAANELFRMRRAQEIREGLRQARFWISVESEHTADGKRYELHLPAKYASVHKLLNGGGEEEYFIVYDLKKHVERSELTDEEREAELFLPDKHARELEYAQAMQAIDLGASDATEDESGWCAEQALFLFKFLEDK